MEEEFVDIPVTITWSDNNDSDGNRPSDVTIRLYADGIEVDSYVCSSAESWSYTFTEKPRYTENGEEITYTVNYELPYGEYQSFLIFDTDYGIYTPVTAADSVAFTVERVGRFVLVGEVLPEPTDPETEEPTDSSSSESSSEADTGINVSVPPVKGTSAVIMTLVIISVICLVIIVALVYTYTSKQDY